MTASGAASSTRRTDLIYFCVGSRENRIFGYTWRVWWSLTSFYMKARYATFGDLKISLHGPDERHSRPGFKLAMEGAAATRPPDPNSALVVTPGWLPRWFGGRPVVEGVTHAITYRVTADLFTPDAVSAPVPREVGTGASAYLIPPPPERLRVVDVDMFVCDRQPYWPNEQQARRDNACLGPLRNHAGQCLTAVIYKRSQLARANPPRTQTMWPATKADTVRGIHLTVDQDDVLWVSEEPMSRTALQRAGDGG